MAKQDKDDRADTGLLGKEIDREFWQFIHSSYLSEEDIRFATTKFIRDPPNRTTVWTWVKEVKKGRYKGQNAEERNPETDLGANDDFMEDFKEHLMNCYSDYVHHPGTDHLTRTAILARRRGGIYKHFDFFNPKIFVSWVEPGACGYCIGTQGSGKTSLATKIAEWCHEHYGMKVISAIPLLTDPPPDWYLYCAKGSMLVELACMFANQDIRTIVLTDEAYTVAPGQKPLDPRVMRWTQLGRLNRKLRITQFVVGHRTGDIHSDIKRWSTFRVNKLTRRHPDRMFLDMTAIVDGGNTEKLKDYVKKVPLPTVLNFNTDAIASFQMDFDPQDLYDYLSRLEHGVNQYQAAIDWFQEKGIYYDLAQKRDLAFMLLEECGLKGKGAEILAEKFGVKRGTIYRWAKEKRDSLSSAG